MAEMGSMSNDSVKIPKFDGKRGNYAMWRAQFVALCALKNCSEALMPTFKAELPDKASTNLDETKANEKKQMEAKEKNSRAMNLITLAMQTASMLAKIEASKSDDWPDGLAYVFFEKMDKKFKPKDTMAIAEQTTKLMKLKLGDTNSPEELGDKIASLETKYGNKLSNEQKIAAIVSAGGVRYAEVIQSETRRKKAFGDDVTADDLIEAMEEVWRLGGCGKKKKDPEDSDSDDEEVALGAVDGSMICYKCHQKGHKANKCPNKSAGGGGRFPGKCHHCGEMGHKAAACWEKPENERLRPAGWKSKMETAGAVVEVLIVNVEAVDTEDESMMASLQVTKVEDENKMVPLPKDVSKTASLEDLMAGDESKMAPFSDDDVCEKESVCKLASLHENASKMAPLKCDTWIKTGVKYASKMASLEPGNNIGDDRKMATFDGFSSEECMLASTGNKLGGSETSEQGGVSEGTGNCARSFDEVSGSSVEVCDPAGSVMGLNI